MKLQDGEQVKWFDREITRTGEVYARNGEMCVLQHPSVLSGDGTRDERLAKRQDFLNRCTLIAPGLTVEVNGEQYTLKLNGHAYSDAYRFVKA
jgi:hypothetical protein